MKLLYSGMKLGASIRTPYCSPVMPPNKLRTLDPTPGGLDKDTEPGRTIVAEEVCFSFVMVAVFGVEVAGVVGAGVAALVDVQDEAVNTDDLGWLLVAAS